MGKVVQVVDGDTISVLDLNKQEQQVRLLGIDAPERGQPFSKVSKQNLSELVFGKQVTVQCYGKDRNSRTIGKVVVNGIDASLEQVRAGLAWFYRKYASSLSVADRKKYGAAESEARSARRGLWS